MRNAYAMIADTIDYGEWKDGIRIEDLVYSGGTFSTKIGSSLATGAIGWTLGLGGYMSGSSDQPESVSTVIKILFIHFPLISAVIIIISLLFYNLDKIYPKIIKDLKTRESSTNSEDKY